jgi:hypothetical protein
MVKLLARNPMIEGSNPTHDTHGLYYKFMTIVKDDSRVVNKLETSLTDDARVVIYDRHMFIVQATGVSNWHLGSVL